MNPSPTSAALIDPGAMFANAFGALIFSVLLWLVLTFLVILGSYWLIRLAVRHGTMDTARWQAATMSQRSVDTPVLASAPAPAPPARPRARRDPGVPVPPRSTMEW